MLLVNGDLRIQGAFRFYGPILVKGKLDVAGGAGMNEVKFYGGVIAANVNFDVTQSVSGNATIVYSSCAIEKALQNSAPAFPLRSRSWANLY